MRHSWHYDRDQAVRNHWMAMAIMATSAMIRPMPGPDAPAPAEDWRDQMASTPSTEANQPPRAPAQASAQRRVINAAAEQRMPNPSDVPANSRGTMLALPTASWWPNNTSRPLAPDIH